MNLYNVSNFSYHIDYHFTLPNVSCNMQKPLQKKKSEGERKERGDGIGDTNQI